MNKVYCLYRYYGRPPIETFSDYTEVPIDGTNSVYLRAEFVDTDDVCDALDLAKEREHESLINTLPI